MRIYGESEVQTVDINDSAAVVLDVTPDPSALKIGTTVIASFDGFSWEAGNIAEIRHLKETGNDMYRVRFISGGDTWVFSLNRIRILRTRNPKGMTFYVKKYLRMYFDRFSGMEVTFFVQGVMTLRYYCFRSILC